MKNVNFIEAVVLRPTMYTTKGSYEEVVAFLEGFYGGLGKADPVCRPVQEWLDFKSWIAGRLNLSKTNVFFELVQDNTESPLAELSDLVHIYFSEYYHK